MTIRAWKRSAATAVGALLSVAVVSDLAAQPAPTPPTGQEASPPPATGAPPTGAQQAGQTAKPSTPSSAAVPPPPPSDAANSGRAGGQAAATTGATRPASPPPRPPTPQQVAALEALRAEADAYEKGAREYRDAITSIIQLHYAQKRNELLSGLDREIATERVELQRARETAIARLEQFVAKYSGDRSHPEATPDAMYRLAALYEERARAEDAREDPAIGLRPAIALYKRMIREFPKYREIAGVYYFLGHAYNDSGRLEEAQQVWRSLVCNNHFAYPTPPNPKDPDADTILPLPGDKPESEWILFRKRYPTPESLKRGGADVRFVDPYPDTCKPLPQPGLRPGEEPRYVAEVWWQIGNWEFDQLDLGGGRILSHDEPDLVALPAVWDYNRAASAYVHALQFKKPPLYGVALYKYAWTLFKQQRYEAATREFVRLLEYTDEQQRLTGDPGADFRAEAYTYIAGSLTNVDFRGPEPHEPFIPRPDIIETEANPVVAEQKLHVAIDRVKDPQLIPQDKSWTIEIYKALANEYRSLNQFNNAIEVYELILKKWPMDPSAPEVQAAIAETYDQMNVLNKPGTPEHDAIAAKALEARTKLANYIGNTPWVDANKDNPAAIQKAERLVRGGLRLAAVQHTNNGRAALQEASQSGDQGFVVDRLQRALAEYRLAAIGWDGYLRQDENSPDAYESRYWLADARRQVVRIQVVLHRMRPDRFAEPAQREIDDAKRAALDVRDSNEDDKYLDNAALWVVDMADVDRDLAYQRFDQTKGTQGVEQRNEVKFTGEGDEKRVVKDPIPPVVLASVRARDEYVERVPATLDPSKNGLQFQYYNAETFFLYGHFDEARARFEPMYRDHCGKDDYGYRAWEKLITMSNLQRDAERSRQLAEAERSKSCAISEEQRAKGALIVNPTLQEAAYVRAREKFKEAQNAKPGPERDKLWREAAGLYEAALSAAPGRDEAPEAAMNAAYAYKQVGEFNKAIELYNKFIGEYGSEERLNALQKGDARAKTAPDPKRYEERLQYLNEAYDALSTTYFGFFNYQRAAETYDKISNNERFDAQKRRTAAQNAMVLYARMGQREKMQREHTVFTKLNPPPDQRANADYLVASFDYNQWNPQGADSGANRQARQAAEASLMRFYNANRGNAAAGKYNVEAAYRVAKMKKAGGDGGYRQWLTTTIGAWNDLKARGTAGADGKPEAMTAPYADYAAEADYTLIDEELRAKYDYESGHHRYSGAVEDIVGKYEVDKAGNSRLVKKGQYQKDAELADQYDQRLQKIADTYPSLDWVPAAIARKGSLYDSLRTGLYNTVPPALKYFTPQQEAFLKRLEDSGRDELIAQADELRDRAKEGWRSLKERELAASDEVMVRNYATAAALARQYNVRNPAVQQATARLAYYTDIIGDAKMKQYVEKTRDPNDPGKSRMLSYADGQFVQSRSGISVTPPASGKSAPLPVAP